MSRGHRQSLLFAGALCVACSLLLTAASTGLKSFQQRNIAVDRQKNILKALGIISAENRLDADQIEALYRQKVQNIWADAQGRLVNEPQRRQADLAMYVHVEQGGVQAYVVPIDTRGLWGPIHGYLAIANDGVTVRGFTVYQHAETPGLGGEIETSWFGRNFAEKKIVDRDGRFASITIAKGHVGDSIPAEKRPNYVDGISGATLTGQYLSAGLRDILQTYEPVAIQFRLHNPRYLRAE